MSPPFRLFATLGDGKGSCCRIFCDGLQNFLFERTFNGIIVERFRSNDPNRFHRYVYELGARGWDFAWATTEGG